MTQSLLIRSLQNPALYDHPITKFRVVETHISWVILTGSYAYKIKKPMSFPFTDFSTLEQREYFCREEVKRNSVLAPEVYCGVIPIYGSKEAPNFQGEGEIIEYAIKMIEFPQSALFDRRLQRGELTLEQLEQAAVKLAEFHQQTPSVPADSEFGEYTFLHGPVRDNFIQIKPHLTDRKDIDRLETLRLWAEKEHERLRPHFLARKQNGQVKQCHGDAHLGNIALWKGYPIFFDCIEFNRAFCWTDVMGDLGFLAMDLEAQQRPDFAAHVIDRYFMETGDYQALYVLTYYKAYRAMVRAKVSLMYLAQDGLSAEQRAAAWAKYRSCVALVSNYTQPKLPMLIMMHGLSGSGKSTVAYQLIGQFCAIRLRSDVERKRLFNLKPFEDSQSPLHGKLYTEEAFVQTYQRLVKLAETCLQSGFTTVIDAACLRKAERAAFCQLAEKLGVPFWIIHCQADEDTLQQRIITRQATEHDPSEAKPAVLAWQKSVVEPLTEQELRQTIKINTTKPLTSLELEQQLFAYLRATITASHQREQA